ncbi:thiol:disulfide interchange protein [Methylobacterium sp. Leaf465]|uniref:thiol:disulfide interchange protein TlpA n=1 Tax=Methylobacterium sp. Leaf465 TaxID=1736385 RepID=UPI0006F276F6|nr:TlpA disulfide reductase family protein [Methylobacterium sp. Leaf465]KQT73837.1 thiol:disulfide interchange protein [Methylobacterium sp. Leaf465]
MPGRRSALIAGAVLVAALGAGLAVYGTGSTGGNSAGPCAGSVAAAARIAPLARGAVAALQVATVPVPAPALAFKGPEGTDATLDGVRGLRLVNLWATWCAPCKAEMPALDRLQGRLGGPDFSVVAINVDTRNLAAPPTWLKQNGIARLAYYADPGGRVLPAIQKATGSLGLPTTLLVDGAGCTLGVMKGPAEWDSADGVTLIEAALGRS